MNSVTFKPWVGSKYATNNRFGKRILVLGESHYGDPAEIHPNVTIDVVRIHGQEGRHAFFTKIAKLLLGMDANTWISDEQRAEVWDQVCFYNYVQSFPGFTPRIRPTYEMWLAAEKPFLKVLDDLKPDVVLVLGKALAHWLPELPREVTLCKIQHPSTGFDYAAWNPLFATAVASKTTP